MIGDDGRVAEILDVLTLHQRRVVDRAIGKEFLRPAVHGGVFAAVPAVTGALFFRERLGQYEYHHFTNPRATLISRIVGGAHEGD